MKLSQLLKATLFIASSAPGSYGGDRLSTYMCKEGPSQARPGPGARCFHSSRLGSSAVAAAVVVGDAAAAAAEFRAA